MSSIVTGTLTVSRDHFLSHMAGAISCGLDLAPLYRKHGISPAILDNPGSRIPYETLINLRFDLCRQLGDESEGFDLRPARWGSTVLFCRAIVASRTLKEVLLRYKQFDAVLNDEAKVTLAEDGDEASVNFFFANRKCIDNRAHVQNRLFFLLSFLLWLSDRYIAPRRIAFAFPRPEFARDYSYIVPCPYRFGQPANSLVLDRQVLRMPVQQSPRTLNQFLSNHLYHLIRANLAKGTVAERVRRLVAASAATATTLETASALMGIPVSSLRRRLSEEETSFHRIKDEIRKERAVHCLTEKGLSVAETAALTGFSDAAAFSRAFKGWTSLSPSEYQRLASQGRTRALDKDIMRP